MRAWYKTLFSFSVTHEYYAGRCRDFDILIPPQIRQLCRNGRILLKNTDGVLYGVYEADSAGKALQSLAGVRLRFGLKLNKPHFSNFTELTLGGKTAFYRNHAATGQLDAAMGVELAGSMISHEISKISRPVTLKLVDQEGTVIQTDSVTSTHTREVKYENGLLKSGGALTPGYYRVQEAYSNGNAEFPYYVEPGLYRSGVFGLVEIKLDDGFQGAAPEFEIAFRAREQMLKYYVVAREYSNTEFAKLNISDTGFGEDQRPEVTFTRLTASNFTSDDLKPELIRGDDTQVVLFKSDSAQARRQKARKKIQLNSNSDVLIPHLPAPSEEHSRADLIIHVAKP